MLWQSKKNTIWCHRCSVSSKRNLFVALLLLSAFFFSLLSKRYSRPTKPVYKIHNDYTGPPNRVLLNDSKCKRHSFDALIFLSLSNRLMNEHAPTTPYTASIQPINEATCYLCRVCSLHICCVCNFQFSQESSCPRCSFNAQTHSMHTYSIDFPFCIVAVWSIHTNNVGWLIR